MKRIVSALSFIACICLGKASLSLQALQAAVYNPKVYKLDNGLEVIVLENHRAPLVIHMMCFRVGTNDSPWGKSGLAHYLEHLMFKGRPDSAAGNMMREVTRLGGDLNAQTTGAYTFYHETVPEAHLETIMKLDAERMSRLEINDRWVKPEINVILEERHMRVDNTVAGKFIEALNASDIRHHPSRLPIIGWAHEIRNYTTKDAQDFYQNWYAPNNAFLVIGGDVTFEKAKKLAEKYYGPIPARPLPSRLKIEEPEAYEARQTFEMTSDMIENPFYVERYHAPTFRQAGKDEFYALVVLENLLSRAVTGRLTESLVEKQHLAVQVSVSYAGLRTGPGTLQLMMVPSPKVSLSRLEKALAGELDRLIKAGITASEVENTKHYLLSDLVYTQDDITQATQNLASLYASGMSIDEIEAWSDRIKSVTLEQVNKAMRNVFGNSQRIVGRLTPKSFKTHGAD